MNISPTPIIGVSLSHRHERTAISVTERAHVRTGETFNAMRQGRLEAREGVSLEYRVRHLERSGPLSRYAAVAQRIPEVVEQIGEDFSPQGFGHAPLLLPPPLMLRRGANA